MFKGKTVTIFGGGDSALDWAVELSKIQQNLYTEEKNLEELKLQ